MTLWITDNGGVKGPLAWLPATTAALALRLQSLDAAIHYRDGMPAREVLSAYKYIQRPGAISLESTSGAIFEDNAPQEASVIGSPLSGQPLMGGGRVRVLLFPPFPEFFIVKGREQFDLPVQSFQDCIRQAEAAAAAKAEKATSGRGRSRGRGRGRGRGKGKMKKGPRRYTTGGSRGGRGRGRGRGGRGGAKAAPQKAAAVEELEQESELEKPYSDAGAFTPLSDDDNEREPKSDDSEPEPSLAGGENQEAEDDSEVASPDSVNHDSEEHNTESSSDMVDTSNEGSDDND